jgi:hypothetical protein
MIDIGAYEAALLLYRRVFIGVACPGFVGIVVIIAPFCEVICELETRSVSRGILKVNDHKLLMGVLWKEQGRRGGTILWVFGDETENVAVLRLYGWLASY